MLLLTDHLFGHYHKPCDVGIASNETWTHLFSMDSDLINLVTEASWPHRIIIYTFSATSFFQFLFTLYWLILCNSSNNSCLQILRCSIIFFFFYLCFFYILNFFILFFHCDYSYCNSLDISNQCRLEIKNKFLARLKYKCKPLVDHSSCSSEQVTKTLMAGGRLNLSIKP